MTEKKAAPEPDRDAAPIETEDSQDGEKRYWPILLLLIVLSLAGGAAFTYPQWKPHLKDFFPGKTPPVSPQRTVPDAVTATAPTPASDQMMMSLQESLGQISSSLRQLRDQSDHVIASSAEVQQGMEQMAATVKNTPSLALESRLFVAAYAQSRWIDRYFAWADIASMPSLPDDKKDRAASLRDQSQKLWEQQQQWLHELRQTTHKLHTLAPALQGTTHASRSVREWLNQNVQLRQSPLNQHDIQKSVRDIEKMLILIDQPAWPDTGKWKELLAHIHQIVPEASWPAVPDDFAAVRSQAETIRLTAENWIKE